MFRTLVMVAALVSLVGCQTSCPVWQSNEHPGGATYVLGDCSDGEAREASCTSRPGGGFACTCSVGGAERATFDAPATGLVAGPNLDRAALNDGCGWEIEVP